MKCMCAQTRPRFIFSSERVFGGMEFAPMLTPRNKWDSNPGSYALEVDALATRPTRRYQAPRTTPSDVIHSHFQPNHLLYSPRLWERFDFYVSLFLWSTCL